jgi:hypothetical protein
MGRPHRFQAMCESCPSIDVRELRRNSQLSPGMSFSIFWHAGDVEVASVWVSVRGTNIALSFKTCAEGAEEWTYFEQVIPVDWTECYLGGGRPWFRCIAQTPAGNRCDRRVAKLYLASASGFACRHCYQLSYASQHERYAHRGLNKARKIRMRLGGDGNLMNPFPPRPKGMHRRTYERMRNQFDQAAQRCGLLVS